MELDQPAIVCVRATRTGTEQEKTRKRRTEREAEPAEAGRLREVSTPQQASDGSWLTDRFLRETPEGPEMVFEMSAEFGPEAFRVTSTYSFVGPTAWVPPCGA